LPALLKGLSRYGGAILPRDKFYAIVNFRSDAAAHEAARR
jgi:hypothetical protein